MEEKKKRIHRKRINKPRSISEVLDVIDRFMVDETVTYDVKTGLWNILSALRGPDEDIVGAQGRKWKSTSIIRSQAFPLTASSSAFVYLMGDVNNNNNNKDIDIKVDRSGMMLAPKLLGYHFENHISRAATALKIVQKERKK